ncbi:MAG: class I SAM-dependent methyltransferase [Bacteroidota bacterium]
MALVQHKSVDTRFQQQVDNAATYLIPFIEEGLKLRPGMKIMEIGCGEGGVLKPFVARGCEVVGVDLAAQRIANAQSFLAEEIKAGKAEFMVQNVYEDAFRERFVGAFDLILLKDTIEHIPEQEKFIPYLKQFLKPEGKVFFGFPPWYMPFGGHQQICSSKVLGLLPYYHLLPRPLYRGILKLAQEPDRTIRELMEIKDTGISLDRFERIMQRDAWHINARTIFLFNPIYKYKFGLKPRKQANLVANIPFLRNFVSTAGWYLVEPKN